MPKSLSTLASSFYLICFCARVCANFPNVILCKNFIFRIRDWGKHRETARDREMSKEKIKTYVRLTFFDCFGIISTDGTSAMAETTGVCGGSSVLLASIGTSTFECSLVDCSGSFDVSHDGSFDDFCKVNIDSVSVCEMEFF